MVNQSKVSYCAPCDKWIKAGQLKNHNKTYHSIIPICGLCEQLFADRHSLLSHIQCMHPQLVGLLKPETEELKRLRIAFEKRKLAGGDQFVLREFQRLGITYPPRVRLIVSEHYIIGWDDEKKRQVFSFELLTSESLDGFSESVGNRGEFLADDELPGVEMTDDANDEMFSSSHLVAHANKLSSKEAAKSTMLRRNAFPGVKEVNVSPLYSVESLLRCIGANRPCTGLLTILKYDAEPEKVCVAGAMQDVSSKIGKLAITDDQQMLPFLIDNVKPEERYSFLYYRSTVEEVLKDSTVGIPFVYPLAWETAELFKCLNCRDTFPTLFDRKIHHLTHDGNWCPHDNCRKHYPEISAADHEAHVRTHKRFACPTCKDEFFSKEVLKKHEATHLLPQFKCKFCGREFVHRFAWKRHEEVVHSTNKEETFECPEDSCDEKFATYQLLHTHIRRFHVKGSMDSDEESPQSLHRCKRSKKAMTKKDLEVLVSTQANTISTQANIIVELEREIEELRSKKNTNNN